VNHITVLWLIA